MTYSLCIHWWKLQVLYGNRLNIYDLLRLVLWIDFWHVIKSSYEYDILIFILT